MVNGGFSDAVWNWWFSGKNPTQGWKGVAQVDMAGGGFYRNLNVGNYLRSSTDRASARSAIANYLQAGCGVSLWIDGPGSHMITCWGSEFDAANASSHRSVYVTDSDDAKGTTNPTDQLQYYPVKCSGGQGYLQNHCGSNSWGIRSLYGLARSPSAAQGAAPAGTAAVAPGAVVAFAVPVVYRDAPSAARSLENGLSAAPPSVG